MRGSGAMVPKAALVATLVGGLAVSMSCGTKTEGPQAPAARVVPQQLVVIALDGVRADAVGEATPRLAALAGQSTVFDSAFTASPVRTAALASVLTGLYPTTHAALAEGATLADEVPTFADAVAAAGRPTAAFVLTGSAGVDDTTLGGFGTFSVGPEAAAEGSAWLQQHAAEPFGVVMVVGGAPQVDGDPAAAEAAYPAYLGAVDATVGSILDTVGQHALVAVVGLRGAAFGEHGADDAESLYPQVVRVPMMLRVPRRDPQRIGKVVETVDLLPTMLQLAELGVPSGCQGTSLVPLMDDAGTPPYIAFGEGPGGHRFAALGGYLLLSGPEGTTPELYELGSDPAAEHDISAAEPDRVKVLVEHLGAWQKMVSAASYDPDLRTEELDDDTLEQLKSLGYIQ